MRFSANLGFLFSDRPLLKAIDAAAWGGFDAVEVHFPFDVPAAQLHARLQENGLPLIGLNTWPGALSQGDFGLAALRGRQVEAREAIDQAVSYAQLAGAGYVHVMAGKSGGGRLADRTLLDNLAYAADLAGPHGIEILVEPINRRDVPDYHFASLAHAVDILAKADMANTKLIFDCYHMAIMEDDVSAAFKAVFPLVGHVQIAAIADRGEPDRGTLDYRVFLSMVRDLGYARPIGAEYKPRGDSTQQGLSWLLHLRDAPA